MDAQTDPDLEHVPVRASPPEDTTVYHSIIQLAYPTIKWTNTSPSKDDDFLVKMLSMAEYSVLYLPMLMGMVKIHP